MERQMANRLMLQHISMALATLAACGMAACGSSTAAGGGGSITAGKAGDACNPLSMNQGCYNGVRMQCLADSTSTTGGKWALIGACASNEACTESADPSSATKHIATCKATGSGADTTTGGDIATGEDVAVGSDSTIGKDGTGVVGSCGDGFCNTGETAVNCPADCGTAPVCNNNGTCDAGETKANCPADCNTVAPKCNNDGTCDAGETTANCPGDCPAGGTDPTACLQSKCAAEYQACGTDQACVTLASCVGKCSSGSDTACINPCAQTAGQAAVDEYNAIGKCGQANGCFGGTTTGSCGDGTCGAGETKTSCPADCGSTPAGNVCDAGCNSSTAVGAAAKCYCDSQCQQFGDCCNADGSAQAASCAGSTCTACNGGGTNPICGNGTCDAGETSTTCPPDCPATAPVCGDGKCQSPETTASCPGDCPAKTCTTYADVQQIFLNNCNGCHNHQFGNNCSAASSYSMIAAYVANGSMPQGKKLSSSDKAKIAAWATAKNACTTASCP
jgi:hypothetical protein